MTVSQPSRLCFCKYFWMFSAESEYTVTSGNFSFTFMAKAGLISTVKKMQSLGSLVSILSVIIPVPGPSSITHRDDPSISALVMASAKCEDEGWIEPVALGLVRNSFKKSTILLERSDTLKNIGKKVKCF